MWPDPLVRYRRAEYLQLCTPAGGVDEIWDGHRWVQVRRGLEVLSHFGEARRPADVIDRFLPACGSGTDAIDVVRSIALLVDAGALVTADGTGAGSRVAERDLVYHAGMLADHVRVEVFLEAVRALVRPGDVVIDAGTGSGVLAVAAARAGARRVYAIESGGIADIAARVFADNGVADRVQLVRGDARIVSLPEHADVLITETIGTNPFDEGILDVVRALKRQLRPGARLLPATVSLLVAPLAMPDAVLRAWLPHDDDLLRWLAQDALDLSALTLPAGPRAAPIPVDQARQWMLADPVRLLDVVLAEEIDAMVEGTGIVTVRLSGAVNALALGFDADLGAGHHLNSWVTTDRAASWDVSAVRLSAAVSVVEGSLLAIHVQQPASGDPPRVSVLPQEHLGVTR